ncbi:nucleocapsid protein [Mammarenavirus juninense]|uniref:Nucleoprotein n=6 Tax=Junin mammarenavirus TaxID=2169991 RepID=Q6UY72_JUNIN|nr:nucleocapsid protein [Mammarenavirus juninense]BCZ08084.1 nucleocapsid protein [Mammarenavirus sp.]AAQ55252.1 nucleocapsid protein [Mammarenavirus juninense]AAU34181.1 nucleoprotein [Mammarenavirus juninense]AEB32437.1 nucleocapsid protein [Mammarenavirus juninense]AEB32441.1 nucleocapsid protein [Mammarenavirus juninense]
MAHSKEVPSFRWTQSLRRGLSQFTQTVKSDVLKDAKLIADSIDFNQVAQVQRALRKTKKGEEDLNKLRDLNKEVDRLMSMRSVQRNTVFKVGDLGRDELMELASDLEKLKNKIRRAETGSQGVYMGNLSQSQLAKRSEILRTLGFQQQGTGGNGVVRIWDVKDPSKLNNQFGSVPALTIACMTVQGGETMNSVIQALTSLGLLYTVKYPNLSDLDRLTQEHDCLQIVTKDESSINISGYNFSLSAAVKAGASILDGGNMLETIRVTPENFSSLIKSTIQVKRREGMFIDEKPGNRNPYENLLYKLCLSGDGWPYIGSRSQITGRSWDNTSIDLTRKPVAGPRQPEKNGQNLRLANLTEIQEAVIREAVGKLDPTNTLWLDIEGPATDPVEMALFQPAGKQYIHCFRKPHDEKGFKNGSRHSHGILMKDIEDAMPGVLSYVIGLLPPDMVVTTQGSDDIRKLFDLHGRRDLKLVDVKLTSEQARQFDQQVWEKYGHLCKYHNGVVVNKKKREKDTPFKLASSEPHCALLDCIMFQSVLDGKLYEEEPTPLLPPSLLFLPKAAYAL